MRRARSSELEHQAPVRAHWLTPGELLPGAGGRRGDGGESGADAADRRGVHASSVLRQPPATQLAATVRTQGQPQTGSAVDAQDGLGFGGAEAQHQPPGASAQGLPLPAAGVADHAAEPGVVRGHHLHPPGQGVRLSDGRDGLAQLLRARLGGLGDPGRGLCVNALESALRRRGRPEIFNTDQGAQFTGKAFTGVLKAAQVRISMDGKGRALDNIMVERLWRSVKYEEIYLKDYQSVAELVAALRGYFEFYNHERPHQAHDGLTPAQVYHGEPPLALAA